MLAIADMVEVWGCGLVLFVRTAAAGLSIVVQLGGHVQLAVCLDTMAAHANNQKRSLDSKRRSDDCVLTQYPLLGLS